MPLRTLLLLLVRALFLGRQALVLENLALRQQLAVLSAGPNPRTASTGPAFRLIRIWAVAA